MNTPIQGSAADIIKLAMNAVQEEIEKRQLKSRLLVQVHDELVLEVPAGEKEEIEKTVERYDGTYRRSFRSPRRRHPQRRQLGRSKVGETMPELPEVETIRSFIEKRVQHKVITAIDVSLPRLIRNTTAENFVSVLTGTTIEGVSRRKYLFLHCSGPSSVLVHLRMTGSLLYEDHQLRSLFRSGCPRRLFPD